MVEALVRAGFTCIEAFAPCPTDYGQRRTWIGKGIDELGVCAEKCVICYGANPTDGGIITAAELLIGRFIDVERPTFFDLSEKQIKRKICGR